MRRVYSTRYEKEISDAEYESLINGEDGIEENLAGEAFEELDFAMNCGEEDYDPDYSIGSETDGVIVSWDY